MRTHRRAARVLVAPAVAAALALSGCTSGDASRPTASSGSEPSASEQSSPDGATARPRRVVGGQYLLGRWPLTGRRAQGKAPRRPVLVVKIDNTSSSVPQLGLGRADMVVEELVEGGQTRLAAFYYERLPRVAGPVRSLRATDIPLASAAGDAVVVASGGAPPTVRRFARAGVKIRSESARGFFRIGGRTAPYNLMVRLPDLERSVQRRRAVPPAYLPWGNDDLQGPRARSLTATFSAARASSWEYRGGRYRPLNGYQADGDRFLPTTILALRVPVGDAGYRDPAGNPVPETRLIGRGAGTVFHGGRLRQVTWVKPRPGAPLRLESRSGRAVTVPPGRTWIELVPRDGGDVSWSARR